MVCRSAFFGSRHLRGAGAARAADRQGFCPLTIFEKSLARAGCYGAAMTKIPRLARRFASDRRGSIVIPLAICTGVCLMVTGAAIDYTRAFNAKVDLQA